jgi:hypothetical protein
VSAREILVAVSATALQTYRAARGEKAVGFEILAPSYSRRNFSETPEIGNHKRLMTRFWIPQRSDDLLSFVASQAASLRGAGYGVFKRFRRLPDRLLRRALKNVPPVIVNWDAVQLIDRVHEIAGTSLADFAVAAPLLPHQQCSFIWWAWDGRLNCSLTTDDELVHNPEALLEAVSTALSQLTSTTI